MQVTLKIQRYNPEQNARPHWQEYQVEVEPSDRLLDALHQVKWYQDGTLAFRRSCAHGVCGSDAMTINNVNRLACKLLMKELGSLVTVEPLRGFPIIKDLVVDMEPFFDKNRAVQPWLQPTEPAPERERLVDPVQWAKAEPYTNCILCASCYGVCPAAERDPDYLGPAALAKHYRFLADVRDVADDERVALVDSEQGVWGCDMVWNCVEICPKGVPPTQGIGKTRARIRRAQRARNKQ
jgi:succinate dehydrogenase / fumarate reductase iron-sulfur subunit